MSSRACAIALASLLCGCASGSSPALSGPQAEEVLAAYAGRWVLDEASSSAQIPNRFEGVPDSEPVEDITRNESREMRRYRRMLETRRMSVSEMRATVEVLRRRPETLLLRVDGAGLSYTPTPGSRLIIPLNGEEVEAREGEERVRSKLSWDGLILSIEHVVVGGGRVRESVEVIGDRMIMTRSVVNAEADQALTLAYDRN